MGRIYTYSVFSAGERWGLWAVARDVLTWSFKYRLQKISTSEPLFLIGTESVEVYGASVRLQNRNRKLPWLCSLNLNDPLIFFLSVFSLIHTCWVCLKCKQSPQRFTQQCVPTLLRGAHLQLMAWTDPRSVHSITLPLPPDLTPGDDGSERRTFKTNSGPDNSTPVQWGLVNKSTRTMKPTQNKYNIAWEGFSQTEWDFL